MEKTKVCSKCKQDKPSTTEYFIKRKTAKDGLNGVCKECRAKYMKLYRKENKEHLAEQKKKDYQENKQRILNRRKQYYKDNREYIIEYNRHYRKENKEIISMRRKQNYEKNKELISKQVKEYRKKNKNRVVGWKRKYYEENRDYVLESVRRYQEENPHIARQSSQRRRAKLNELPYTLTLSEWENIKHDFNNSCAYCGLSEREHLTNWSEQLHQEHFIPLVKGGEYTHNNIIPACKSCNASKGSKDFFEWYPSYEFYDEDRENFILEYLGYTNNTQQLSIL